MDNLLKSVQPNEDFLKILVAFALNCAARETSKAWFQKYFEYLVSKICYFPSVCLWIVEAFTLFQTIREFVIENPVTYVRKVIVHLVFAACQHC